jgi:hypothetical protein
MNRFATYAAAAVMTLASTLTPALADQWNKKTYLNVNETIQIPGAVLQPGRYVMRLMDSPSNRHIVQVFNEREDQLITTVLAIPNYRLQPTGETEFGWWETPAGQPKAMRAWFYPGDNFGQEFAYPKNMSVQLAQANQGANVPTTYSTGNEDLASARVGTVNQSGNEAELGQDYTRQETTTAQSTETQTQTTQQTEVAQTPAPVQETQETQVAQNTVPADQQATTDTTMTRSRTEDTLPQTSSPFPLVGIAGFAALGASMAVRKLAARK